MKTLRYSFLIFAFLLTYAGNTKAANAYVDGSVNVSGTPNTVWTEYFQVDSGGAFYDFTYVESGFSDVHWSTPNVSNPSEGQVVWDMGSVHTYAMPVGSADGELTGYTGVARFSNTSDQYSIPFTLSIQLTYSMSAHASDQGDAWAKLGFSLWELDNNDPNTSHKLWGGVFNISAGQPDITDRHVYLYEPDHDVTLAPGQSVSYWIDYQNTLESFASEMPEPSTLALSLLGVIALIVVQKRKESPISGKRR